MNFAEQLAYWYLRLNGFFPLANFVRHRLPLRQPGDVDLLAVRFPHVNEPIGGGAQDWDRRLTNWGLRLGDEIIGFVVEVKSRKRIARDFRPARVQPWLHDAVNRLGLFGPRDADDVAGELLNTQIVRRDGYAVAKLFVDLGDAAPQSWLHLSLGALEGFIVDRMRLYREKGVDRMFFPGDLIQYLAWGGGRWRAAQGLR